MPDETNNQHINNPFSVMVEFDRNLFDIILKTRGKSDWNAYIESIQFYRNSLVNRDAWPPFMPIHINISFHKENFFKYDLSNLNFTIIYMRRCNFEEADLSCCKIGSVNLSSFKNSNLSGAIFSNDISGANFEGANLDGSCFKDASFSALAPPLNLPLKLYELCETHDYGENNSKADNNTMYEAENEAIRQPEIALYPKSVELI